MEESRSVDQIDAKVCKDKNIGWRVDWENLVYVWRKSIKYSILTVEDENKYREKNKALNEMNPIEYKNKKHHGFQGNSLVQE